jgi:hypothetical protein
MNAARRVSLSSKMLIRLPESIVVELIGISSSRFRQGGIQITTRVFGTFRVAKMRGMLIGAGAPSGMCKVRIGNLGGGGVARDADRSAAGADFINGRRLR